MTPYSNFLYFGLLVYVLAPALIARAFGVRPRGIVLPATLVMLAIQYGLGANGFASTAGQDIGRVAAFAVLQWAVAVAFLRARSRGPRRPIFYAAVMGASVPLALAKFLPGGVGGGVGFLGISYLTFRALDVIFVIQDGLVKDMPIAEYFAFLLFFPAVSAGPIDRYRRFQNDYRRERTRGELLADLDQAVQRFFRGMLYAFIVARLIDFYWLTPASHQSGPVAVLSYMYAYSLYLFFDFAGYSAFAIGTGYLLGVRMAENFRQPFLATSIVDFWYRWHISLSSWLRDHVYGRFVLAATKGRWFKNRYLAGYLGSLLAFGIMGVWHGPTARYISYGLYHAVLIVAYGLLTQGDRAKRPKLPPVLARVITFQFVCVGFLIFSGRLF